MSESKLMDMNDAAEPKESDEHNLGQIDLLSPIATAARVHSICNTTNSHTQEGTTLDKYFPEASSQVDKSQEEQQQIVTSGHISTFTTSSSKIHSDSTYQVIAQNTIEPTSGIESDEYQEEESVPDDLRVSGALTPEPRFLSELYSDLPAKAILSESQTSSFLSSFFDQHSLWVKSKSQPQDSSLFRASEIPSQSNVLLPSTTSSPTTAILTQFVQPQSQSQPQYLSQFVHPNAGFFVSPPAYIQFQEQQQQQQQLLQLLYSQQQSILLQQQLDQRQRALLQQQQQQQQQQNPKSIVLPIPPMPASISHLPTQYNIHLPYYSSNPTMTSTSSNSTQQSSSTSQHQQQQQQPQQQQQNQHYLSYHQHHHGSSIAFSSSPSQSFGESSSGSSKTENNPIFGASSGSFPSFHPSSSPLIHNLISPSAYLKSTSFHHKKNDLSKRPRRQLAGYFLRSCGASEIDVISAFEPLPIAPNSPIPHQFSINQIGNVAASTNRTKYQGGLASSPEIAGFPNLLQHRYSPNGESQLILQRINGAIASLTLEYISHIIETVLSYSNSV